MEIGPRRDALKLFVRRLQARSTLSDGEQAALLSLQGTPQRIAAHRDIVHVGEVAQHACLIVDGLAARFAQMEDGSRQIVSLHLPGDVAGLSSLLLPRAAQPLTALTATTIIRIPHEALRRLCADHPAIAMAIWRDCAADAAVFAQWLVNVGRKSARGRIAHLICEMAMRSAMIGRFADGTFNFGATQEQMGDAIGMTSVHVNRSLRSLREEGLMRWNRADVTILDWTMLALTGEFRADYLHLRDDVPVAAEPWFRLQRL